MRGTSRQRTTADTVRGCRRARVSAAAVAAALHAGAVLAAVGLAPPAAADPWIELDLAEATRVNARLDSSGLGANPTSGDPLGASMRHGAQAPSALAELRPASLPAAVSAVEIQVDFAEPVAGHPDVLAEVRGRTGGGPWSEWRSTPVAGSDSRSVPLPRSAEEVQLRLALGPEAEDNDDRLTAVRVRGSDPAEADPPAPDTEPFTARLFTTRIGLVGHQTANGHVIRSDDYFAALPSRRGLATRGAGEYTVRACTTDGQPRCVYVPVWDVGPWNITDDHWNRERESWIDLPHGKPQAQAAYQEGHNEGLDGFGRQVRNPAGIDLADGAFRYGLRLPTNSWVSASYLWTAPDAARGTVGTESRRDPVVLRNGPGLDYDDAGRAAHSARVDPQCLAAGEPVDGPQGETTDWYRLRSGLYIPGSFVTLDEPAPPCAEGDTE